MKSFRIFAAFLLGLSAASASSYTEVRDLTLASTGTVDVETTVGGIIVQGWDKDYVSVRASVSSDDPDPVRARGIASLVQIAVSTDRVWAAGPSGESWSVSFEISVPQACGLRLRTHVGGISITGVAGEISAQTSVGAIALSGLAGAVDVKTSVGAVTAALDGATWTGQGLTMSTSTGAIHIAAPADYAAHFDLRTNLGGIVAGFPGARVAAAGMLGRKLVFDTGSGGATIRATTSLGQIELKAVPPVPPPSNDR
jgi:hypothetical protein